ncbi:uncharacterized protein LOC109704844 [Ananas comosus]|uniref:Uncharacterized protein LOC109704844 n=1 Tax=Ananas comosus TaxID=4615 RepID=A0A6P5ECU6_ANACO|nr:uncharacterized protein LOC109704844 [Ananas comosus]
MYLRRLETPHRVNLGSLSDTIDFGTPCNLTTSSRYTCANLSPAQVVWIGKKCADLVKRSTITQIASCPPIERGQTLRHEAPNISLHSRPPIECSQLMIHLGAARVIRVWRPVGFLQDQLAKLFILGHAPPVSKPERATGVHTKIAILSFVNVAPHPLETRIRRLQLFDPLQ